MTAEAEAVKVAEVEPGATATEAGTVTVVLLLASTTELPPEGAAALRVTVQVELPAPVTVEGLQASVLGLRVVAAARFSEVFTEVPFKVAVI